ncbi:MAG: class I SAM-dependent methyltransferase [Methanobrevibacter boviskoreani]|jgi:SAM-dependent methyltransferase|uniref:class I SAM-dependent methyltransferase n=1 Tax=Methanobrevibacter boviskoreani TaxID=1348249 RepID=UPI003D946B33
MSFKNYLLSKSNSYNYYKSNYIKLNKENEKLNGELKKCREDNRLLLESIDDVISSGIDRYCPICNKKIPFFTPIYGRKHAFCPSCKSLERTRLLFYYINSNYNIFNLKENKKLLHFAPEKALFKIFDNLNNLDYWPVDINPKNNIRKQVDMCDIPFEDNSFDFIISCHVLEHIPDDKKAMSELYRVIKPNSQGGIVFLMVPIFRELNETFENPEYNTDELRTKYFGQKDHVRKYSTDFKDRLESVGFDVTCYDPVKLDKEINERYGFLDKDIIFICKK